MDPDNVTGEARLLPFSTRARVTLAIARAIAASRGERDLTPLHVALGLLREGENAALAALHHQGVDLLRVHRDIELALGESSPGGTLLDEVTIPLSPGEARQIDAAKTAAAGRGTASEAITATTHKH